MGQQASKKSKKGAKDKDRDFSTDSPPSDTQLEDSVEHPHQSTLSRATATSTANGSDSKPVLNGNPAISVSDPQGAVVSSPANSRIHGSPYPAKPPIDQSPNVSGSGPPSPSPLSSSPRPSPLPVDIPVTQTILSNTNPFSPGSTTSSGPQGESVGNGSSKEKLKQYDIDDMIQRLLDVGYTGKVSKSLCLKNTEITAICLAARDIFLSQPTLIELSPPVKIVGDVHGQYSDLIRLFEMCGFPPASNYLFLGDYVDRGKQSLETILLLLCYKIKYPENFFLLRGNHECANVTRGTSCFRPNGSVFNLRLQSTVFMTNANDGVTSKPGKPSLMFSIVFPSRPLLPRRYFVYMAAFLLHFTPWTTSNVFNDRRTFLISAFSMICFGQIRQIQHWTGKTTSAESATALEKLSSMSFWCDMIWI